MCNIKRLYLKKNVKLISNFEIISFEIIADINKDSYSKMFIASTNEIPRVSRIFFILGSYRVLSSDISSVSWNACERFLISFYPRFRNCCFIDFMLFSDFAEILKHDFVYFANIYMYRSVPLAFFIHSYSYNNLNH